MDVRSLYSNIKHKDGLEALKQDLNNRTIKDPPTEVLLTLMKHVLTLNNFNFNGKHFLQIKGCAMGTVAAPSYATIYMGEFEETYIYPEINNDCLFYARYIDDIFLIYTGGETKLMDFLTNLNTKHDSIKFDHDKSMQSIPFLDTLIYIDENRHLQTTLYTKPTDTHNYLHFKSSHPKHLKESLPYSQALRLKRICSDSNEFKKHSEILTKNFKARGYKDDLINKQIEKANSVPRETTLELTTKKTSNRIPLVTTFNDTLPPLAGIIKNRWNIVQLKPELKDIFQAPGIIAYRRPQNLKEIVGSNTILNNKVFRKKPKSRTVKYCQPCNAKNNLCCNHLQSTNSFTSSVTKTTYKIFHESNCKSRNVIYLLECIRCKLQYVGKSEWPFNIRLNNYRHRIKSTDYNKLLPVEQHFRSTNHNFTTDAKFTIIERIEKNIDNKENNSLTTILESHEDNWILRLKTLSPNGLNGKLNHPENITL